MGPKVKHYFSQPEHEFEYLYGRVYCGTGWVKFRDENKNCRNLSRVSRSNLESNLGSKSLIDEGKVFKNCKDSDLRDFRKESPNNDIREIGKFKIFIDSDDNGNSINSNPNNEIKSNYKNFENTGLCQQAIRHRNWCACTFCASSR